LTPISGRDGMEGLSSKQLKYDLFFVGRSSACWGRVVRTCRATPAGLLHKCDPGFWNDPTRMITPWHACRSSRPAGVSELGIFCRSPAGPLRKSHEPYRNGQSGQQSEFKRAPPLCLSGACQKGPVSRWVPGRVPKANGTLSRDDYPRGLVVKESGAPPALASGALMTSLLL
jgi:hypothetical protein